MDYLICSLCYAVNINSKIEFLWLLYNILLMIDGILSD